jgi:hypothetical protein
MHLPKSFSKSAAAMPGQGRSGTDASGVPASTVGVGFASSSNRTVGRGTTFAIAAAASAPPDLDWDEMALEHPEALVGGGDGWAA